MFLKRFFHKILLSAINYRDGVVLDNLFRLYNNESLILL